MDNQSLLLISKFLIVYVVAVCSTIRITHAASGDGDDGDTLEDFRLPLSLTPVHYELRMLPILDETEGYVRFTAPGSVQITVSCNNLTNQIALHANNLTIDESSITVTAVETVEMIPVTGITFNPAIHFLEINLEQNLEIGKQYIISVMYIAQIPTDPLNGMYLDYYDDLDTGVKNYVATTLFAPYHARKAFPCFDEPDLRATFDITVGRREGYHSMSNGQLLSTTPIPELPGWYWDTFERTPSMSTYIIAMIVSNFEYEEAAAGSFRNVTMRTYAAPYQIQRGGGIYAVNLAAKLLSYYENFFQVEYPLTKAYSVALPHFFFNAMENWGLITYKEPVILYFPDETSEADRYKINYVTSHELAHQWFGNLINCKWWAYVWLKEGFATFYAHYGMNHTNPELDPWTQFPINIRQVAMDFDSTAESHPLENFPGTSEAVADIYTRIPYEKGASILRMTSKFLTEDVFHAGIRKYVALFQYKGANQDDLFQMLQEVTPESIIPAPVKTILDTWTTQSGFPLLRVSAPDPNYLLISQEKFIGEDTSNPDDTWWVPVTVWPSDNPESENDYPDIWIPQGVRQVSLNITTDQPIILNPRSIGYYLVEYDTKLTGMIQKQLEADPEYFPASARNQVHSDFLSLALSSGPEYVSIEAALNMTKYIHRETNAAVWRTVMSRMKQLYKLVVGTKYFPAFQGYWLSKSEAALVFADEGIPGSNISTLKIELFDWLSMLDAPAFNRQATEMLRQWIANPQVNPIPVEVQDSAYCSAIRSDKGNEIWEFIYQHYLTTRSPGLRLRFLKAMTCSINTTNISRLLTQLVSNLPELRGQNKEEILKFIAENPRVNSLTFNFIRDNIEKLKRVMTTKAIVEAVSQLANSMKTNSDLQTLQEFIVAANKPLNIRLKKSLHATVQKVKVNMSWFNGRVQAADSWFKSQID